MVLGLRRWKHYFIVGLLVLVTACLPVKPSIDRQAITFGIGAGGRLHIFQDEATASTAGLPPGSKVHTIDSNKPIGSESLYLKSETSEIQRIETRVRYEYHAETGNTPAMLEFVVRDASGNVLWSKKESYLPEQLKTADQVGESQYDLDVEIPEGTSQLVVDVYPIGAGDYGFYISELSLTIHMIVYENTLRCTSS